MKKVVIFGGGSGLSQLLKGLKLFPIEVTAIVTVADNGKSTGRLREDFNIPAVGDITKVLLSMSNVNKDVYDLLNYRFDKNSSIGNHSIKNLLLTALLDTKKDFKHSIPILCELLNIKGKVLPITEDNVNLVGITKSHKKIIGEAQITESKEKIIELKYDKKVKVSKEVSDSINKADLIIFSSGSLLTSILPHIIIPDIVKEINNSKAKKMYICNLVTQPGETDDYKVSDHIKVLEKYLGKNKVDAVIANDAKISDYIIKKYATLEQKDPVILDKEKLDKMKINVISDKTYIIEDTTLRHDSLKTAYLVFSYLMEN